MKQFRNKNNLLSTYFVNIFHLNDLIKYVLLPFFIAQESEAQRGKFPQLLGNSKGFLSKSVQLLALILKPKLCSSHNLVTKLQKSDQA